jgi:hypothetical protein
MGEGDGEGGLESESVGRCLEIPEVSASIIVERSAGKGEPGSGGRNGVVTAG